MGRIYKPKNLKSTDRNKLKEAFYYRVETKCSLRVACERFDVKMMTLQDAFTRSRKESDGSTFVEMKPNVKKVFTAEQEQKLVDYTIKIAKMFYGLPRNDFRRLAFNYARACKSPSIPQKWFTSEIASDDWYYAFMNRHPELSLKAPEAISLARATAFNKPAVQYFFDLYGNLMDKYQFSPDRIFNIDESCLTTVMKPLKVVCEKGSPVSSQVSRERGETMTFLGIINAAGQTLPPVFILPRKRYNEAFMRNTIYGSKGLVTPTGTGWMTMDSFVDTLRHIKEKTFYTKENRILIIMDNAECHKSIEALDFCLDNSIVILTLPPHTTDKLQPLDVSVYSSFELHLRTLQNSWRKMHPHVHLSIQMMPELASSAWFKAAYPSNILSGFGKTGLWPINPDIFPEEAFMGSLVSDQPPPESNGEAMAASGTTPSPPPSLYGTPEPQQSHSSISESSGAPMAASGTTPSPPPSVCGTPEPQHSHSSTSESREDVIAALRSTPSPSPSVSAKTTPEPQACHSSTSDYVSGTPSPHPSLSSSATFGLSVTLPLQVSLTSDPSPVPGEVNMLEVFPKVPPRSSSKGRKRGRAGTMTDDSQEQAEIREKHAKKKLKEARKGIRGRPRKSIVEEQPAQDSSEEEEGQENVQLDDSSEYSEEHAEEENFEEPSPFQEKEPEEGNYVLLDLPVEEGRFSGEKVNYVGKVG